MKLREHLLLLRKWWWIFVACAAVAAASALIVTANTPPVYRVRTTLLIGRSLDDPNPSNNDVWLTRQLAQTYADLARRRPVQEAARDALGLDALPDYTVRIVADTQMVEIEVTDSDPRRAQQVADALGEQLIAQSPARADPEERQRQTFVTQQLDALETRIGETEREIADRQRRLEAAIDPIEISDLQQRIEALRDKLDTLQTNYAALLSNTNRGALNSIRVVEPAVLPTTPVGPQRELILALALVGSLLVAGGAVYVLEYLDDTLKDAEAVRETTDLVTLAAVPSIREAEDAGGMVVFQGGDAAAVEAYRVLRTNLQFASLDHPLRRLLVTSPSAAEGKSITVANLGAALAQLGQRVLIVDCDLHRPRQHQLFALVNNVGVSSALLDSGPPGGLLQETAIPGLRVLTAGPQPPNSAEMVGSQRMRDLLAKLDDEADVLLLDSPPVTAVADARILAGSADGVLVVIDAGRTRQEPAKRAVEALRQVQARILGVLLNRVEPRRGDGDYYRYASDYDSAIPPRHRRRGWRLGAARRMPAERSASSGTPAER